MLNNLFFGYMPLKWKRLARVLSIILLPVSVLLGFEISEYDEYAIIIGCIIHIILVPIISYTIKPFVVKD